jgi:hypothetical protein
MQLIVANGSAALLPGGYADVRIDLAREVQPLHIPASAAHQSPDTPRELQACALRVCPHG